MSNCRLALILVLLLALPGAARGWGWSVHALIGELAAQQLSAETRAQVQKLLSEEDDPRLAAIAVWADKVRDEPEWEWTAPMHYVKFRDARCNRVRVRDCQDGLCVYGAVNRYRKELANRRLPQRRRAEALKFLVHFVADAHQPMHAGYRDDRGGNNFQISIDGTGTNLHAVWDTRVLALTPETMTATVERLLASMPASTAPVDPRRWAEESCAAIDQLGIYPDRPGRLPADYLQRMRPQAEARVQLAAKRLAEMLESALGDRR